MLLVQDFLISVYNDLEVDSYFRSDLVDLFGTPDGAKKGFIGSNNKSLCWDWGETGFRKITTIVYFLSGGYLDFDRFYKLNILRKSNILQSLITAQIIDRKPQMLYLFKHSSKKIPAFIAEINEISWKDRRIWITFKPKSYFLLDSNTWKEFWDRLFTGGREDQQKWYKSWEDLWNIPRIPQNKVKYMLHSGFSRDQYHIIPVKLLLNSIKEKANPFYTKPRFCFIKNISRNKKRISSGVQTDNQTFWGLLSEIIGKTQVKGTVDLKSGKQNFLITDIPANTINEQSLVFKQEIGTATTICQTMLDVFGNDYLDLEFSREAQKNLLDSVFLDRAVKVSMVAKNYEKKYSETDFDYQLNLNPLTKKYPKLRIKILFDLTAGLWNKSATKDKDEFVRQWKHNLTKIPEQNKELYVLWHYGLTSEIKDGSYKGEEIGEYLTHKTRIDTIKYTPNSINNSVNVPKLILLPFFRDSAINLEKELKQISSDKANVRRKSMLYGALKELLEKLR